MDVISDVGSATSNSYVSVSYAESYFGGHVLGSKWLNTPSKKGASIIQATSMLDALMVWQGTRADDIQALEWPRILSSGEFVGVIPPNIKKAVCELANHLVSSGSTVTEDSFSNIDIGPIKLKFNDDKVPELLPKIVTAMLNGYGVVRSSAGSGVGTMALVR